MNAVTDELDSGIGTLSVAKVRIIVTTIAGAFFFAGYVGWCKFIYYTAIELINMHTQLHILFIVSNYFLKLLFKFSIFNSVISMPPRFGLGVKDLPTFSERTLMIHEPICVYYTYITTLTVK